MADKETDRPENKTLTGRMKKVAEGVTKEDAAARIFGQELKRRVITRNALLYPIVGGMMAVNLGVVGGMIGYGVSDQSRPGDESFAAQRDAGLVYGHDSFQALSVGGQTYLVVMSAPNGDRPATYAVYVQADADEFHLVSNNSMALGYLHQINRALQAQQQAIENGRRLPDSAAVTFLSVDGLSVLHEEEAGSLERAYDALRSDSLADQYYNRTVNRTAQHVKTAMQNILDGKAFGDPDRESAPKYNSMKDYEHAGRNYAVLAALGLMVVAPVAGAGLATRRRRRDPKPA